MDLTVNVSSLKFKNPLILSSGILGISVAFFKRISPYVGALTTKSIGKIERKGNPNPVVIPLDRYGLINSMGLPNPGINYFVNVIRETKKKVDASLIVSVFGFEEKEYVEVAGKAEEAGADAVELNLSCPHTSGVHEFSQDKRLAYETVKNVKEKLKIPVFAKLSPNVTDITEIGAACEKAGADGLTAINTVKSMYIDVWMKKPVFQNIYGGLSGPAIHPLAVRCVYDLYKTVSIPIIGVGGVIDWTGAVEFILAGARAVGIGTGVYLKGLEVFRNVKNGIEKYMETEGFQRVEEMIGYAHKQ